MLIVKENTIQSSDKHAKQVRVQQIRQLQDDLQQWIRKISWIEDIHRNSIKNSDKLAQKEENVTDYIQSKEFPFSHKYKGSWPIIEMPSKQWGIFNNRIWKIIFLIYHTWISNECFVKTLLFHHDLWINANFISLQPQISGFCFFMGAYHNFNFVPAE